MMPTSMGPGMNIFKALAGTTWCQQSETLILTHKSLLRSIIHYAAPVWYPNASRSNVEKLQKVKNNALCIALGCRPL